MIAVFSLTIANKIRINAENSLLKHSRRDQKIRERLSRRAIKLICAVAVMFFVCHIPLNVFFFALTFNLSQLSYNATLRWYYTFHVLQVVSTCINPLIYGKLHQHFKMNTWMKFHTWMRGWLKDEKEVVCVTTGPDTES